MHKKKGGVRVGETGHGRKGENGRRSKQGYEKWRKGNKITKYNETHNTADLTHVCIEMKKNAVNCCLQVKNNNVFFTFPHFKSALVGLCYWSESVWLKDVLQNIYCCLILTHGQCVPALYVYIYNWSKLCCMFPLLYCTTSSNTKTTLTLQFLMGNMGNTQAENWATVEL